jgi:RimJ/RimL family protein N-acetyltransferase
MLENTLRGIMSVETERLLIHEKDGYIDELKGIFTDEKTMRYYPQFLAYAKAGFLQFLDGMQKAGLYAYPVILKENGGTVGFITLNNIEESCRRLEIGYFLGSGCWGNGYAREIVTGLVSYLKEQNWHRIEATVYSGNASSERVLDACGFVREGVLRDKYVINGEYHDDIIYSVINKPSL